MAAPAEQKVGLNRVKDKTIQPGKFIEINIYTCLSIHRGEGANDGVALATVIFCVSRENRNYRQNIFWDRREKI